MTLSNPATILSFVLSLITSRSNCEKLARMFSVNRPIEVRVSNDCVVETNPMLLRSSCDMKAVKSPSDREMRSIL